MLRQELLLQRFLQEYLAMKGRSLSHVAGTLGWSESALLGKPGQPPPQLGTKQRQVLEKETGLPWRFLEFLHYQADPLAISLVEAHQLVFLHKQSDRRKHKYADLRDIDYRSTLAALRKGTQREATFPSLCASCGAQHPALGRLCQACALEVNGE